MKLSSDATVRSTIFMQKVLHACHRKRGYGALVVLVLMVGCVSDEQSCYRQAKWECVAAVCAATPNLKSCPHDAAMADFQRALEEAPDDLPKSEKQMAKAIQDLTKARARRPQYPDYANDLQNVQKQYERFIADDMERVWTAAKDIQPLDARIEKVIEHDAFFKTCIHQNEIQKEITAYLLYFSSLDAGRAEGQLRRLADSRIAERMVDVYLNALKGRSPDEELNELKAITMRFNDTACRDDIRRHYQARFADLLGRAHTLGDVENICRHTLDETESQSCNARRHEFCLEAVGEIADPSRRLEACDTQCDGQNRKTCRDGVVKEVFEMRDEPLSQERAEAGRRLCGRDQLLCERYHRLLFHEAARSALAEIHALVGNGVPPEAAQSVTTWSNYIHYMDALARNYDKRATFASWEPRYCRYATAKKDQASLDAYNGYVEAIPTCDAAKDERSDRASRIGDATKCIEALSKVVELDAGQEGAEELRGEVKIQFVNLIAASETNWIRKLVTIAVSLVIKEILPADLAQYSYLLRWVMP